MNEPLSLALCSSSLALFMRVMPAIVRRLADSRAKHQQKSFPVQNAIIKQTHSLTIRARGRGRGGPERSDETRKEAAAPEAKRRIKDAVEERERERSSKKRRRRSFTKRAFPLSSQEQSVGVERKVCVCVCVCERTRRRRGARRRARSIERRAATHQRTKGLSSSLLRFTTTADPEALSCFEV